MTVSQARQEIRDLRHLRFWLAAIFVASILLPIPLGAIVFYQFENTFNKNIASFKVALEYASDAAIGTKFTNATAVTFGGKIVSSLLAFLRLVFFGFISSIITISLQIYIKEKELSYLGGYKPNVR